MQASIAEAYLKVGRLHDAVEWAMKAAEAARQRGERGFEAWALRLLAEIELVRQPPDASAAERRYGEARALASTLGMRPLLAHCHHGLAEVYRRMDRRPEAHEHLTTATTMDREMDMRFWLEQARRKWVD